MVQQSPIQGNSESVIAITGIGQHAVYKPTNSGEIRRFQHWTDHYHDVFIDEEMGHVDGRGWNTGYQGIAGLGYWKSNEKTKGLAPNDNLYLIGFDENKFVVWTDTQSGGGGRYNINTQSLGLPGSTLSASGLDLVKYSVKRNDKPTKGNGDFSSRVTVQKESPWGMIWNDYKNYENAKLIGDSASAAQAPCPGTTRRGFVTPNEIECVYNYGEIKNMVQQQDRFANSTARVALKNRILDAFCDKPENATKDLGNGVTCMERDKTNFIANRYCRTGDNMTTTACRDIAEYDKLYGEFCEANPSRSECQCYNVFKEKCDPTSKTGAAGCAETAGYVDLRNATPEDFRDVWNGQRHCGGQPAVCAGSGKYIPPEIMNGCKSTIQVCAQDIDVGGNVEASTIEAKCNQFVENNNGSSTEPSVDDGSEEPTEEPAEEPNEEPAEEPDDEPAEETEDEPSATPSTTPSSAAVKVSTRAYTTPSSQFSSIEDTIREKPWIIGIIILIVLLLVLG